MSTEFHNRPSINNSVSRDNVRQMIQWLREYRSGNYDKTNSLPQDVLINNTLQDLKEQFRRRQYPKITPNNVKNAIGLGATMCYPSDSYPYEIVSCTKSGQKVMIRQLEYKLDRENSPDLEFTPGGFVGHISNLRDQVYRYFKTDYEPIAIRWSKKRQGWYKQGVRFSLGFAYYFVDYNN